MAAVRNIRDLAVSKMVAIAELHPKHHEEQTQRLRWV